MPALQKSKPVFLLSPHCMCYNQGKKAAGMMYICVQAKSVKSLTSSPLP